MIVDFPRLARIARRKSKAAVRAYLDENRIVYRLGRDGAPWTTTDAINRILLPADKTSQPNLAACHSSFRQAARSRTGATTSSSATAGMESPAFQKGRLPSGEPTTASRKRSRIVSPE